MMVGRTVRNLRDPLLREPAVLIKFLRKLVTVIKACIGRFHTWKIRYRYNSLAADIKSGIVKKRC